MKLGVILLLITCSIALPGSEAWSQKLMIQMGADGSLIIQPEKKPAPPLPLTAGNLADVVISKSKMIVLRSGGKKYTDKGPVQITTRQKTPAGNGSPPRLLTRRTESFQDIVARYAAQHGIDSRLVQLVIKHESGFNPQAVSPKGARGLMQLMPGTAAMLGVADPFDAEQNIAGGVKYLKECLNRFNNDVPLALAAYNAGPENVSRHQGVPPFTETRNYVSSIMQEYTGQTPVFPTITNAAANQTASPPLAPAAGVKKSGRPNPLACLPPLYVGGPGQVNLTKVGKVKIITISSEDDFL